MHIEGSAKFFYYFCGRKCISRAIFYILLRGRVVDGKKDPSHGGSVRGISAVGQRGGRGGRG